MDIKHKTTGAVLFTVPGDTLRGANLLYANLLYANLLYANLLYANLQDANLLYANLRDANLRDANLQGANLQGADLQGANLLYANLQGANLQGAKGLGQFVVAGAGALTVYKKVSGGITTLAIPASAARVNAYGSRKCRAEYAVVLDAPADGRSMHDYNFVYKTGATVRPDSYDPDPRVECSHGIHFFLTESEAEDYV